jgi:putative membrane-bound dehydrogenase-like protein
MRLRSARWIAGAILAATGLPLLLLGSDPGAPGPAVGPQTEKRFPPLTVPPGFKATLFACDPLIEYPSVIAAGPRPGAIFVAIDYMTGMGYDIVRRDEIRLVEDMDGDGYADRATVFARGFNSIQGLAYHDGTLYVMHAPFLTALRDAKGTGVADERRDLLVGLGLTPEQNPTRLHCANGVTVGHDGWLYLALGDNGVDVQRPEGDRLVLHGGGILRCRPDGSDLHVFATDLRNIYDIALDAELNVFVRDNENDGGTYMIRVCHSFHGADHGYPYHYEERPDEALAPLADLGLGSSAGGVCYLEQQFPQEYRGNLLFCEWGRSVVRYPLVRAGSGFAPVKETEFVAGAASDPYGFKPTDVIVQRDGTLMVSDWGDGQRPRRGRGRIYHVAYVGEKGRSAASQATSARADSQGLPGLDSAGYGQRCAAQAALERLGRAGEEILMDGLDRKIIGDPGRLHAVWALAHIGGPGMIDRLLRIAETDPAPGVRAQAVRAVADLADSVLIRHKLDAGAGDARLGERLAVLAKGQDSRVLLEIVIALGRLRWAGTCEWLRHKLDKPDASLAHAALHALRNSGNWQQILMLLDEPDGVALRDIARRALAEQFEPMVVDGLIERLRKEPNAARASQYADLLTRVYKKPGPWKYWGYRPPPRPANAVAWERSEAIAGALDRVLAESDRVVRLFTLRRMQREKVPVLSATLTRWLELEHEPERTAAILASLGEQAFAEVRGSLQEVIRDRYHGSANRLTALSLLMRGQGVSAPAALLASAWELEDGPVLAEVLRRLGNHPDLSATSLLLGKLHSVEPEVRAAALEALAELRAGQGREALLPFLQDKDARVRHAAVVAAGKLEAKQAIEPLLKLTTDADSAVRLAGLDSLRLLREPRVVPLAVPALTDRALAAKALECLAELGGPDQAGSVTELALHDPSADIVAAVVRTLTVWRDRDGGTAGQRQALDSGVARVHGANGILVRWQADGSPSVKQPPELVKPFAIVGATPFPEERTVFATGIGGRVLLAPKGEPREHWQAYTEVMVAEPAAVELSASSSGSLQVYLNGRLVHERREARTITADPDRFACTLVKGTNRLLVRVGGVKGAPVEFHLRFRRKSARVEIERWTQAALNRAGNSERGRGLFFNVEKSLCLKCHRLGDRGERIGPELTGVGGRFARVFLIESILEPSRAIAPSFGTVVLSLKNGRVQTGVKVAETNTTVTLADNQGEKHVLAKADIEDQQNSPVSTMPEGLEKRFTEDEFVDLIAFLASQKEDRLAR